MTNNIFKSFYSRYLSEIKLNKITIFNCIQKCSKCIFIQKKKNVWLMDVTYYNIRQLRLETCIS